MNGIHETSNWQSRGDHGVRSIGKDEPGLCANHLAIIVIIQPRSVNLKEEKLIWAHAFRFGSSIASPSGSGPVVRHTVAEACGRWGHDNLRAVQQWRLGSPSVSSRAPASGLLPSRVTSPAHGSVPGGTMQFGGWEKWRASLKAQ